MLIFIPSSAVMFILSCTGESDFECPDISDRAEELQLNNGL